MATIKWGALVTDARGKVGGHFLSSGQGGSVIATNGSALGSTVTGKKLWGYIRAHLATNAQNWKGLTDTQRGQWQTEAANWPQFNRVGVKTAIRGYALYMKVNGTLSSVGVTPVNLPAPKVTVTQPIVVTINALTASSFNITPQQSPIADEYEVYMATRSMSAGRKPSDRDFRIVHIQTAPVIGVISIISEYDAIFGAPLVGGYINMRSYIVNTVTGQKSGMAYSKSVVS